MRTVILIIAVAVVVAFGGEVLAQGTGVSLAVQTVTPNSRTILNLAGPWIYSAKFLCGTIFPSAVSPELGDPLVPGTYLTAINIHNASGSEVRFQKKAVETRSQREPRGQVGKPVIEDLLPDQGLEVDCQDIINLFFPTPPTAGTQSFDLAKDFIKGFVVIAAPGKLQPLDVVGVYTLKDFVK